MKISTKLEKIKNLEDLKRFVTEDLKWEFNQWLLPTEDDGFILYSEEQCQKLALIAFYCKMGKDLEQLIANKHVEYSFTYYVEYGYLYFKMFNDLSLKDPALERIDIDPENDELDHFEIIKYTLDMYTLTEIMFKINIQLNEVMKLL